MQKRKKELNHWAENDYKVNVHNISNEMLSTRHSLSKKGSPRQVPNFYVHQSNLIGDETDFIFKVRNKWIHQRNYFFATKIQSWIRMVFARRNYQLLRMDVLRSAIMIQKMFRMLIIRTAFRSGRRQVKTKAMNLIKRFVKGFKVHKVYKEVLHRFTIDKLMRHYRVQKKHVRISAQITIRYYWFKYQAYKKKLE